MIARSLRRGVFCAENVYGECGENTRSEELGVRKPRFSVWVGVMVGVLLPSLCGAAIYPFTIFTNNGNYYDDPGIDIYMDVWNGDDVAKFTFYNDSTVQSSVTGIYFDDGVLIGATLGIINGSGTLFAEDGPANLPGGNLIGFNADREFNIGPEPSPPANGINNIGVGEWVTVEFNLLGGSLQDVLNELNDGTLRVGVHIQNFADGSSESAVNEIPEPATVLMFGLGGLALLKKRK